MRIAIMTGFGWALSRAHFRAPLRVVAAVIFAVVPATVGAQVSAGDSAWTAGRFDRAKAAYTEALAADPRSVRALYRLALLASWDGQVDRALALVHRGRAVEPGDRDLRLAEARFLSWQGRLAAADSAYGSILAENPRDVDARIGRAQVYYWQGHEARAETEAAYALALDPANREALALRREIRAGRAPQADAGVDWTSDSEGNSSWTESIAASAEVAPGLRVLGNGLLGQLTTRGGTGAAHRAGGELGLLVAIRRVTLTAAAGARRLTPADASAGGLFRDTASVRTHATWRAGATLRLGAPTTITAAYAHGPFDETAALVLRDFTIDAVDLGLETTFATGTGLSLGVGQAWLSDGNRRRVAVAGLTQSVAHGFYVGVLGRMLGWQEAFAGHDYFAPDRFTTGEVRGGWRLAARGWDARVSGGVGVQQIGRGAEGQGQWHAEARLGRRVGDVGGVEAYGGITNSAGATSATTGVRGEGFRYRTAGVRVRIGL